MRFSIIVLFWLSTITPVSIAAVQITAVQRGAVVEAVTVVTFVGQLGDARIAVSSSPGLVAVASTLQGADCTPTDCQIFLQGGIATVTMTTTLSMAQAGRHGVSALVSVPNAPAEIDSALLDTAYYSYIPLATQYAPRG